MAEPITLKVNGRTATSQSPASTPLLYVLRNELGQHGPRFGCGLAQCGACTVHVDGRATRSCVYPLGATAGREVTTLDGLAAQYRQARFKATLQATEEVENQTLHPVQQAFIDEQAAQCGYCINGWIMTAAALLADKPRATDAELRQGLSGLKCRCGTQVSVLRAVKAAALKMLADRAVM